MRANGKLVGPEIVQYTQVPWYTPKFSLQQQTAKMKHELVPRGKWECLLALHGARWKSHGTNTGGVTTVATADYSLTALNSVPQVVRNSLFHPSAKRNVLTLLIQSSKNLCKIMRFLPSFHVDSSAHVGQICPWKCKLPGLPAKPLIR